MIKQANFDKSSAKYKELSSEAKSLLAAIFVSDPNKRITIKEI
jgi:hypothetical protein